MSKSARFYSATIALFAFAQHAVGETQHEYEYPELAVTPRASKRLADEQKIEKSGAWSNYLPFQVSALSTIATGFMTRNDPGKPLGGRETFEVGEQPESKMAGSIAMVVGGGWIGTTVALSAFYKPYQTGTAAISNLPVKKKRDILARERAAEEYIQAPASLMKRLKWLSVVTNAVASGYAASTVKEDGPKALGALATALAFSPLLFVNQYETIGWYQQDYKKRIYGPITSVEYTQNLYSKSYDPSLNLSWFF